MPKRNPQEKSKRRDRDLRRLFGLTLADCERMRSEQGNRCPVCQRRFDDSKPGSQAPCVDHNHDTGAVRGLLCHTCNLADGKLRGIAATWNLLGYLMKGLPGSPS